jgi:hypothetical protein
MEIEVRRELLPLLVSPMTAIMGRSTYSLTLVEEVSFSKDTRRK